MAEEDYSDQTGDYSEEYDKQYGGYPQGYENQYRESDADYASKYQHKRGKNAHNYRQNADDATWARWEGDVDSGKASKHTQDAVNQRRKAKKDLENAQQAGDPRHDELNDDKKDCLETKKDCAGVCWGESVRDTQDGCCLEHQKDCLGVCFGDAIWIKKGGTQYDRVSPSSSQQGDYKCCSRSKDPYCCQTEACNGGCPAEGSGAKPVFKDGRMCICDPKDKGCCADPVKDCQRRCPQEANYGNGCDQYDVFCPNNDGSFLCGKVPQGSYATAEDCYWQAGILKNQNQSVPCTPMQPQDPAY